MSRDNPLPPRFRQGKGSALPIFVEPGDDRACLGRRLARTGGDAVADSAERVAQVDEHRERVGDQRAWLDVGKGPADMAMADISSVEIARHFPTTELAYIGDEIADGAWIGQNHEPRPLALFDGLRTDFSLARLAHYRKNPPGSDWDGTWAAESK